MALQSVRLVEAAGKSAEYLPPGEPSLPELADAIEHEHQEVLASAMRSIESAISCGSLLLQAQVRVQIDGELWEPWVDQLSFSYRTAARYMQLAVHKEELLNLPYKTGLTITKALKLLSGKSATVNVTEDGVVRGTGGTGENEWYTPDDCLAAARDVLGEIDLDPASSDKAQEHVKALKYFTKENDGLDQEWHGRVWLNPPYEQPHIADFVSKMVEEYREGRVTAAVMLTHNYTDTAWFHEAAGVADAICFTRGRVRFYDAKGNVAAPTQGQAFFYFGPDVEKFAVRFSELGFVVKPWHGEAE